MRKRNPAKKSKGKAALTTAGKAVKGFAQGTLSAASQILGAGASALNPVRRKVRNKYIDLVIKGQAKKTPQGWRVGKKTFEQGRGTVNVSSGYYLDRATGLVYAKRARNAAKKKARRRNRDYPYWNVYHIDTKKSPPYDKTFLGSSSFGMDKKEAIEKFRRSHYPGRLRAGTKIIAEKGVITTKNPKRRRNADHKDSDHPIEVTKHWRAGPPGYLTPWQRAHHAGQKQLFETGIKPAKKKNPRKGTRRVGGKSSQLATRRRPTRGEDYSDWSLPLLKQYRKQVAGHLKWLGQNEPKAAAVVRQRLADVDAELKRRQSKKRNASRSVHPRKKTSRARAVAKTRHSSRRGSVAKARKASTKRSAKRNPRASRGLVEQARQAGLKSGSTDSVATQIRYRELGDRLVARAKDKKQRQAILRGFSEGYRLARSKKRNPSAESIRKKFAGRVTGERDVYVPSSTPKGKLAKLGNLVLIQTEQGTIKPVRGSAVLLADTRGKLHIGTTSKSDLFNGPRQSFGEVKRIEYDSSKPHLGYPSPIIWHHKLGEESGHRPTLHADGQGGLVFRGGRYRLTRRGIEN